MNENRIVIYRKGRISGTFSVRGDTVKLELGAFIRKRPGSCERITKEVNQYIENFVDRAVGGRRMSAYPDSDIAPVCWPKRP